MPRRSLLPAFALLLAALPVTAQDPASERARVRFELEPASAAPGETVELRAVVEVDDGWHVYATDEEQGVPTALELELPAGLERAGDLSEPVPVVEEPLNLRIHRGEVPFVQRLRVAAGATPGPRTIAATLRYQTCDDANTLCSLPLTASEELTLEVTGAAAPAQPADSEGRDLGFGGDLGFGLDEGGPAGGEQVVGAARFEPATARPGEVVDLIVELAVPEGFHVYATETPFGTPTRLELDLPEGLQPAGPLRDLEEPHVEDVEFVGTVAYHEGTARFAQRLRVSREAPQGDLPLGGRAVFQRCDDRVCIDETASLAAQLTVAGEPLPPGEGEEEAEGIGGTPVVPSDPADLPPAEAEATGSVLGLAWASVLLGVFMLLQPCTYPMIPITVSIFSKGKERSRARAAGRAGIYAVGIIVSFVIVAGLVQVIFGAAGQGALTSLATNPWVNLVIGGLFVYFAFSFFGYYELGLPAPLQRLMQLGSARPGGDGAVPAWSLFLMGFFFVLTSYTCGAPIVLAVFTTAATEPHPLAIVFATFVFACTVALPYFVLSLVPGAVRSLPKSGSWFSVFKATLGFLELGFALKFFRGADVMWDLHLLGPTVFLALWTALAVVVAAYLLGLLPVRFPHDPKLWPPTARRAGFALAFLGLAGYFGWTAAAPHSRLRDELKAFLLIEPEVEPGLRDLSAEALAARLELTREEAEVIVRTRDAGKPLEDLEDLLALGFDRAEAERILDLARKRIRFGDPADPDRLAYGIDLAALEAAKKAAKEGGVPVFLLFTGHNCVNCQLMESTVLQDDAVEARLRRVPRVALFIDKSGDPEEERHKQLLLNPPFQNATIPAFYLVSPEGEVLARQIGGTGTGPQGVEAFLDFLEEGGLTSQPGETK